jgi:spore germination protein KB
MTSTVTKTYGGHIDHREGARLMVITLICMLFLQTPQLLTLSGGPAAWQVALLLLPIGLVLAWLFTLLGRRFPGMDLRQIAEASAGRLVGTLLMLAVWVWLVGLLAVNLRDFTETFKITLLPNTPISAISVCLILAAGLAAWVGLESIARVSQIFYLPVYICVAVVVIFNLGRIDPAQYFPFWGFGFAQTARGAIAYTPMLSELIILLILGQSFRSPQVLGRISRTTIIMYALTGLCMVLMTVGVLGSPEAGRNPFALFTLARIVQVGRWVERVEAGVVTFWVLAACVRLAILLYVTTLHTASLLRIPNHRSLILPLLVIAESIALLPRDFASVLRLDRFWMQTAGSGVLLIPLLLLALAAVRKKGGRPHAS